MEVIKLYDDRKDADTAVNLKERVTLLMSRLDAFLEGIEKRKPEIIGDYKKALKTQLQEQFCDPGLDLETIASPNLQEEIASYNDLHLVYLQALLQLLGVQENHSSEVIETNWTSALKASLHPAFYRCTALGEVMGREPAIEFVKEFIDTRNYEVITPNLEIEDLSPLWENFQAVNEGSPQNSIIFKVGKGKIGKRVDRCMWYEALLPFNDPELSHLVACYGDKAGWEARYPNIAFTRTTTLVEGGPYCDNCLHDKRYVEKIEHPGEEFWATLHAKLEQVA